MNLKLYVIIIRVQFVIKKLKIQVKNLNSGELQNIWLYIWSVLNSEGKIIKKFKFQWNAWTWNNLWNTQVWFIDNLDDKSAKLAMYSLQGVVSHRGVIDGGHYWSQVKEGPNWYVVDDENVSEEKDISSSFES